MSTSNHVIERTCAAGHVHTVQPWGSMPERCLFPPCGQRFLSPQQVAARTRAARKAVQVSIPANHPSVVAINAGASWASDGALVS